MGFGVENPLAPVGSGHCEMGKAPRSTPTAPRSTPTFHGACEGSKVEKVEKVENFQGDIRKTFASLNSL